MRIARWVIAAVAVLLLAETASAGPIYLGHEYEVVFSEGISFGAARTAAMALPGGGWDLLSIGDAAENTFVEGLLPAAPASRSHFWIGATDSAAEGTWVWFDGTPFLPLDWWGGEPNNVGGEHFLAYDFRGSWAWNDASDGTAAGLVRGFVAERVAAVPEPMMLSLLGLGALAFGVSRRR